TQFASFSPVRSWEAARHCRVRDSFGLPSGTVFVGRGGRLQTPVAVTPFVLVSGPAAPGGPSAWRSRCSCGGPPATRAPTGISGPCRLRSHEVTFGEVRSLVGPYETPRAIAE